MAKPSLRLGLDTILTVLKLKKKKNIRRIIWLKKYSTFISFLLFLNSRHFDTMSDRKIAVGFTLEV